jgi:hypothetical protein
MHLPSDVRYFGSRRILSDLVSLCLQDKISAKLPPVVLRHCGGSESLSESSSLLGARSHRVAERIGPSLGTQGPQ